MDASLSNTTAAPAASKVEPSDFGSLRPLKIGNVEIGFPIVQAALSGYSDWPMRVIAKRLGAPYTVCEVMLDKFLVEVNPTRSKNKHFLHISDEEHPVGGQLMGAEPEQFAAGAMRLVESGFDIIDINFGCPVKKVLGRCRGGFHLSQPDVALEIVRRTRENVPDHLPVTVKLRRGIDDSQESRDNFFKIVDGAFEMGIAAITVHGRTVEQRYIGPSRWEFLKELKEHVGDRIVLGSGDLFTAQDCLDMIEQTGVDGCTIARGAIGNPWIFNQARALAAGKPLPLPPTVLEQGEVIREHYRLADALYAKHCGAKMRKFGIKYASSHPHFQQVRDDFVKIKEKADWLAVFERWYSEDMPGEYPQVLHKAQSSCG